ncbi:MAG TPA: hypothetical protein VJS44_22085, partial [Pyrinomonadaceae bacterium]|nr:hypothetical protein [Pyrinomonadaceae bacterium]
QVNSVAVAPEEALFITILPQGGFDPVQVTRTGGEFRLCLNKRPRADDLVVRLKKQSGELVKEISLPKESIDWSEMVNLAAGSYTLTEANHSGWACQITIQ